ncbi:MAG: SIS domain-containing protein [Oscillospiraceae bacterium]|nr:SIS domain-containing protein [Oscillospiraceae bacterium]
MGRKAEYIKQVYDYIDENPAVTKKILAQRAEVAADFLKAAEGKTFERVIMMGIGSSYNAGLMAKPVVEPALKQSVYVCSPAMLEQLERVYGMENTLILSCSQSGKSASTVELVQELIGKGAFVVGVTNDLESPFAKAVSVPVSIRCGEEKSGAMTKGVGATALVLTILCLEYAHSKKLLCDCGYKKLMDEFQTIADAMEENQEACKKWCAANLESFKKIVSLDMISDMDTWGTTIEGALKVMETATLPTSAYEIEEYLHGPNTLLARPGNGLLLLDSPDKEHERFEKIYRAMSEKNALCWRVTFGDAAAVQGASLTLKSPKNNRLSGFEYLPVLQLFTMELYRYHDGNGLDDLAAPVDLGEALKTKLK